MTVCPIYHIKRPLTHTHTMMHVYKQSLRSLMVANTEVLVQQLEACVVKLHL